MYDMVVYTMLHVYCSVLRLSSLCWTYIAMCYGGHNYVGCILQCALVAITNVMTIMDVYCNVECFAIHFRCILQCVIVVIIMLDVYCSVPWF